MAEQIFCGGCDSVWSGTSRCHCSACHNTFGGVTSFDAHRDQYGQRGKCKEPATLGLVQTDKSIWSVPQQEE